MVGPLAVSSQRLVEIGETAGLRHSLDETNVIAVSGVWQPSVDTPRFTAIMRTVTSSYDAGVPHLVMVDSRSHGEVAKYLARRGATVVVVNGETEGGLARPYVIAAQLIERFASDSAIMVKFEGEKPVFEGGRNVSEFQERARWSSVVSGVRSLETWASMPPFQVQTEFWLGLAIGEMLNGSPDTPSGVIALTSVGRRFFIDNVVDNHWSYLFGVPFKAQAAGLQCSDMEIDFRYDPAVVTEETGNKTFDQKRLTQIDEMLNRAYELYDGEHSDALARRLRIYRGVLQLTQDHF